MTIDLSAPLPQGGIGQRADLGTPTTPSVGASGLPVKTTADYPQKFETVAPGSTIIVGGPGVQVPFEATVLNTILEFGPTGIPALQIVANDTREEYTITASGLYTVQVIVDSRQIAANLPAPENALHVATRPRAAVAIQFKGGIESATEIVRWAIGSTTFRYENATDLDPDHLVQAGAGITAWPGDWIVRWEDGSYAVRDDKTFAAEFVEATRG